MNSAASLRPPVGALQQQQQRQPQPIPNRLTTPMGRVGALASYAMLAFILFTISRLQEIGFLRSLRLYTVVVAIPIPAAFLSGRGFVGLKTFPGKMILAFTAWLLVGLPFSIWRGGTFTILVDDWIPAFFSFVFAASMIGTLRDLRRVMYVGGFSVLLLFPLFIQYKIVDAGGRAALGSGSLSNSNDLAMHVLFGLPFLGFVATDRNLNFFKRMAAAVTIPPLFWIVTQTGSRAGLLTIGGLVIALFLASSFMGKIRLIALGGVAAMALISLAPQSVLERYSTMWTDQTSEATAEARMSAQSRKRLFQESVRQTFSNPVLGVGAGNFRVAFAAVMEAKGNYYRRYQVSHNSYTQISSETGLPGFGFYMTLMIWTFRENFRLYRSPLFRKIAPDISRIGFCLMLSLLMFAIASAFGSNAYRFYMPLMAGLGVTLTRIATETARAHGDAMLAQAQPQVAG